MIEVDIYAVRSLLLPKMDIGHQNVRICKFKTFWLCCFCLCIFLSKIRIHFFYFYQSTKTIDSCRPTVFGDQKNRLIETVLLSTHKICF